MEFEAIKDVAITQGIFCVLFVSLLVWQIRCNDQTMNRCENQEKKTLKDAKDREDRLLNLIENFDKRLDELTRTTDGFRAELAKLTAVVEKMVEKIK